MSSGLVPVVCALEVVLKRWLVVDVIGTASSGVDADDIPRTV